MIYAKLFIDINIELHEARWLCDGSGDINVKNNYLNISVRFYFQNDSVVYLTDDNVLIDTFRKANFDFRLKEMWELLRKRNSIFSIKS